MSEIITEIRNKVLNSKNNIKLNNVNILHFSNKNL